RSRMSKCPSAPRRCRSTWRCGRPRAGAPSSPRFLRAAADERVEHHRGEQDAALEGEGPVAVPLGVDDSELDHPEHGGAEERTDDGAEAAGEQTPADDGADDEDELEADAFPCL